MVDNHWEQLVLGLGYQFWSFQPKKSQKKRKLDPKNYPKLLGLNFNFTCKGLISE